MACCFIGLEADVQETEAVADLSVSEAKLIRGPVSGLADSFVVVPSVTPVL